MRGRLLIIASLVILALSNSHCPLGRIYGRGDVTSGVIEVAEAVLAASGTDRCCLTIVTLGLSSAMATEQIIQKFSGKKGVGLFDIQKERKNGNLTLSASTLIDDVHTIKESSGCMTIVIITEDSAPLKTFLQQFHDNSLLVWPTRLVVVTPAQLQSFTDIRREFSVTNSVIAILEGNFINRRASVHICLPFSLRMVRIASWTPRDGLRFSTDFRLFPNKFKRLVDGGQMKVASENYPPHSKVEEEVTEGGDKRFIYSGPVLTLFDALALRINFTYSLVRPPDGAWGMRRPDGSWAGMVGMVYRKEVDMALGPFGLSYVRSQVIDYTKTMFIDYARVLAKKGETEVDPWGFVMPLTPAVWFTTFGVLVLVLITVSLMVLVSPDPEKTLGNMAIQYVRIFIQQDMVMKSKLLWTRVLMGSWVLLLFVVVKCYSGNLMSLLAVRYIPQPYQTLRKVVDDPTVTMLWEADSAFMQVIKDAKSGIFLEVAETEKVGRLKGTSTSQYTWVVENLVMRGDQLLIVEGLSLRVLMAQHFTKTGSCQFYLSKEMFLPLAFALIYQKNSPMGLSLNERIQAIAESGLYNHWLQTAVPNSTSCLYPPTKVTVQSSLYLRNIWGMFAMFFGGLVLSSLAFGVEKFIGVFFTSDNSSV